MKTTKHTFYKAFSINQRINLLHRYNGYNFGKPSIDLGLTEISAMKGCQMYAASSPFPVAW